MEDADEVADSQDTYCDIFSLETEPNAPCPQSDSLFSQDYELGSHQQMDKSKGSSDVEIKEDRSCLIVLPSDTDSQSQCLVASCDTLTAISSDKNNVDSTAKKRKLEVLSSDSNCIVVSSSQLSTTDLSNSENPKAQKSTDDLVCNKLFKCDITPVKMPLRRSERSSKRRNSFSCKEDRKRPARRLKRCASAEMNPTGDIRNEGKSLFECSKSRLDNATIESNLNEKSSVDAQKISTIQEECTSAINSLNESQHLANDSQCIVIKYSQSESGGSVDIKNDLFAESKCVQPITNSLDDNTYLDSTVSINMDSTSESDLNSAPILKLKSFNSNGCTSSTPEILLFHQMQSKMKNIQGCDSNSTPHREFGKPINFSSVNKPDSIVTSSNSSISPITNGHSENSHINNTNTYPSFDVQVYFDDNHDFLSLIVVKTDSCNGIDISRECQKVCKRAYSCNYSADRSKSSSPSSVTSSGLLQLPKHPKPIYTSSSSSISLTKTNDGTFAIPNGRSRMHPLQNCISLKGIQQLKSKLYDVIAHLEEIYNHDDMNRSQVNEKNSSHNTCESDGKNSLSNGRTPITPSNRLVTPKSTKKRFQPKNKRNSLTKGKKMLPATVEEIHSNGDIHSPEMIACNTSNCPRPLTPIKNIASVHDVIDNNNSPKTSLKNNLKKDCTNNTATSPKSKNSLMKSESITHCPGTLVLAKWVDKNYYSGIVKRPFESNKYVIEFFDGKVKTLLDDFIIFGNTRELPILGQSIYAIVDEDKVYEPSLVLSFLEDENGCVLYQCTTDRDVTVSVKAPDIYVTEDQAKSIRDNCIVKSPQTAPNTPRRRVNRELDLDNIIQGPRSARLKNSSKDSPRSPTASTSGLSQKRSRKLIPPKQRQESESSEGGDGSISRAPSSVALEEVSGVQPEIQKTPRKIDGVKIAGPILIKGASKQITGRKYSKVTKFENDSDTNERLGPIPTEGSTLFKDLHFLLTCTNPPTRQQRHRFDDLSQESILSLPSDSESQSTDKEDCNFTTIPFQKARIKEQLEAGGGIVYSHFEEIPKDKYSICKLIAPRPCFTAKYIQCLGADIKALTHSWVVRSCLTNKLADMEEDVLPTGWSIEKSTWINWKISSHNDDRKSSTPFKDYLILLCSDNGNFIKFWRRVCTLAGANTRTVNDDLDVSGGLVIVTEADCPHDVQNKAIYFKIPLVSTTWVVQCLIEGRICDHSANIKYNFSYNDTD